jgi:hypothetical protein
MRHYYCAYARSFGLHYTHKLLMKSRLQESVGCAAVRSQVVQLESSPSLLLTEGGRSG